VTVKPETRCVSVARSLAAEALACVTDRPLDHWIEKLGASALLCDAWGNCLSTYDADGEHTSTICVDASMDPREAWESICTRLDRHGWVDNPRRVFSRPLMWTESALGSAPSHTGRVATGMIADMPPPSEAQAVPGDVYISRDTGQVFVCSQPATTASEEACPATVGLCVLVSCLASAVLAAESIALQNSSQPPQRFRWRAAKYTPLFGRYPAIMDPLGTYRDTGCRSDGEWHGEAHLVLPSRVALS